MPTAWAVIWHWQVFIFVEGNFLSNNTKRLIAFGVFTSAFGRGRHNSKGKW
jgi:hypothetical protein